MSISISQGGALPPRPAEPVHVSAHSAAATHAGSAGALPQARGATHAQTPDLAEQRRELSRAIERLNEQMRKQGRALSFSTDETLNRTIIQVKDANTGEVVRQIPDETVLKVARSIEDFKGLLLNERG